MRLPFVAYFIPGPLFRPLIWAGESGNNCLNTPPRPSKIDGEALFLPIAIAHGFGAVAAAELQRQGFLLGLGLFAAGFGFGQGAAGGGGQIVLGGHGVVLVAVACLI